MHKINMKFNLKSFLNMTNWVTYLFYPPFIAVYLHANNMANNIGDSTIKEEDEEKN